MQRWFSLFLFQLSTLLSFAQNSEVVTARGFDNPVPKVDSLPGHQWVFAGVCSPAEGTLFQDTISIWVCDSTGKITNRMTSIPPIIHESYTIDHLIGLPDSSILLQYSGGSCDACCYGQVLERWKKDGTLAWQKLISNDNINPIYSATSDLRLFSQSGYHVSQLDWSSGDTLWQYQYSSEYKDGAIFIPNTANFILYDGERLKYYEMDTSGTLKYNLKATRQFDHQLYNYCAGKDGMIYARYGLQFQFLVKFSGNLSTLEEYAVNEHLYDFTPFSNGVMALVDQGPHYKLIFIDSLGYSHSNYTNANREISGWQIKANMKGFSVTGNYEAGPHYTSNDHGHQGWFRYFPKDSLQQNGSIFSVSIVEINQRTPVIVDSTFYDLPGFVGYLRQFEGGNFEMLVKNTGNQAVDSFWINVHFADAWLSYCGLEMCKNVFFHQLLQPGESAWVDFGDIYAIQQFVVPDQFCFWTSGPNARPDDNPIDDTKCVTRIVGIEEPRTNPISLFPIPAFDFMTITLAETTSQPIPLTIYSIDGRKWIQETFPQGLLEYQLNVSKLPPGYYVVQIGEKEKPLIKI